MGSVEPPLTTDFIFLGILDNLIKQDTVFTLNSHTLTFYLISLFTSLLILLLMNVCKIARRVANDVDPDQTPRSAASDLGLHCLHRPPFPNT